MKELRIWLNQFRLIVVVGLVDAHKIWQSYCDPEF